MIEFAALLEGSRGERRRLYEALTWLLFFYARLLYRVEVSKCMAVMDLLLSS